MTWNEELFPWFVQFAVEHKESGDIDPVYPVLYHVQRLRGETCETAIWHTLLYLTWYHLGSAELVLQMYPFPTRISSLGALPTGIERRGMRGAAGGEKAVQFLNWIIANRSPLSQWLEEVTYPKGMPGWVALYHDVHSFPHCGSWAAYKWCDLARNVLGCDITAPDIGLGGGGKNAGPVPGLARLTGRPWAECASSLGLQDRFFNSCLTAGIPWEGREEMETALCDFNSVLHNRYYVGHDIDKQMDDVRACPKIYWDARQEAFPRAYLGELQGWCGVKKELKGMIRGQRLNL